MDYFQDLFGQPELTRRENWDGKEELFHADSRITWRERQAQEIERELTAQHLRNVQAAAEFGLTPQDTIDIDYEEVS